MKRGAESQLTKDGPDADNDDEIEEIANPQDFQKADEATLASRPIRALPKRALGGSRPPSLNGLPPMPGPDADKEAAPQPKFGAFTGFGAETSTSNPFTFAAQPPAQPAPLPSAFAFKPAQLTPTSSSSSFFGVSKPSPPDSRVSPSKPATSPPTDETDAVALKYFRSLRGLNVSFLSAISTAVEKDPFFDVVNLAESYKNLRTTIQSEFDRSSHSSTTSGSATTTRTPFFVLKPSSETSTSLFLMPKPSTESTEMAPSAGESSTRTGGFTLPPFVPPSNSAPAPLPFSITPKQSEPPISPFATTPEPPKSVFAVPSSSTPSTTSSLPPRSGFSFPTPSGIEDTSLKLAPVLETEGSSTSSSPRPTPSLHSFGSGAVTNVFASTKPTSVFGSSDTTSKPTSVFGSSTFGISSVGESNKPSPFNSDSKDGPKGASNLFGGSTTTSSSTLPSILQQASDKPVSVFGSASVSKSGAFTFGKPGGSIGNPVGFGFGSSVTSGGDNTTPGSSSSGFSFVAPSTKPNESLFSPPMTDKSSESTPQPDGHEEGGEEDRAKLLPLHTHDEEGEGEEDEVPTHVVRCRVYRLCKSQDQSEWKDLGVGMLRLKKHKDTHVRRVLMRNSSTGRILINFRISGSLKPTLTKNTVQFVGYDNNAPASFNIRVKTEELAKGLKQALEREIAAVQGTE